ncbi:hypothetical protein KC19_1G032300 [Ceratodon purpureus]|uniref:Molybdopterin synthase catalytic subunit n=1 Tax=Ceratodon purpureus TaxID=3225 RepID=A0A8T0J388_CERPU|nr:hypothetical protein KC19_1G032300 [Ceratodon purpureus]
MSCVATFAAIPDKTNVDASFLRRSSASHEETEERLEKNRGFGDSKANAAEFRTQATIWNSCITTALRWIEFAGAGWVGCGGREGEMAGDGGDVVEIVDEAIDLNKYVDMVRDAGAGAIATFLGTTRDTFEDKRVLELRYEAYHAMALEQMRRICVAARARWSLHRIAIVHRIGVVGIGQESVLVAVSSVHRKESLHACEFLIDELKASVPIWKKEVYETGEAWKQNSEFLKKNFVPGSAQDGGGEEGTSPQDAPRV